jgi:hypothetical protein
MTGATDTVGTKTLMPRAWWAARAVTGVNPEKLLPSLPADGATAALQTVTTVPRHWRVEGASDRLIPKIELPLPLAATLSTGHNAKPPTVGSGWGLVTEPSGSLGYAKRSKCAAPVSHSPDRRVNRGAL